MQVKESDMSKEVIEDYEAKMEYASAERLLKMKKRGDQRLYLVRQALSMLFLLAVDFKISLALPSMSTHCKEGIAANFHGIY